MSRTHRDNQRRLDRVTQRAFNGKHVNSAPTERKWPWRRIPRRGFNRKVAVWWSWKLHKAERYKEYPRRWGRIGII